MEFVIGALGHEMDIEPLDAALMAVRLAAGTVAYWRQSIKAAHDEGHEPTVRQTEGYRLAVLDLSRVSKTAIDAGAAEKAVLIAGRMAEAISLAAEEALAAIQLDAQQRMVFARTFAAALARLEDEPIESDVKQLVT